MAGSFSFQQIYQNPVSFCVRTPFKVANPSAMDAFDAGKLLLQGSAMTEIKKINDRDGSRQDMEIL